MVEIWYDLEYGEIEAKGHAGHGEKGKDIVCAAVSVLMDMLGREAVRKSGGECEMGEGRVKVRGYGFCYVCVLEAAVRALEALEEKYPENVKIKRVESEE